MAQLLYHVFLPLPLVQKPIHRLLPRYVLHVDVSVYQSYKEQFTSCFYYKDVKDVKVKLFTTVLDIVVCTIT